MRYRLLLLLGAAALLVGVARAEPASADAVGWLGRIATAAQKLSYTGVFVYQNGQHSETSRIVHVVDLWGEQERLEAMDGSPREVLRTDGEVVCYLPAQRMVLKDQEGEHQAFPASLPASLSGLSESYLIRKGDVVRIAGQDAQQIVLEPRDTFRYGHLLWADVGSGLLLKARMVDEKNEILEQFTFTQVQIGGTIDRAALKSRLAAGAGDWRVHDARGSEELADVRGWSFRNSIPGFRKTASLKRDLGANGREVVHLVFSDGVASISVFIEPVLPKEKPVAGLFKSGATTIYKRIAGDQLVTVLGEVPPRTLKRLGDGIERK